MESMGDALAEPWTAFTEAMGKVSEDTASVWADLGNGFAENLEGVGKGLEDVSEGMGKLTEEMGDTIGKVAEDTANALSSVGEVTEETVSALQKLLDGLVAEPLQNLGNAVMEVMPPSPTHSQSNSPFQEEGRESPSSSQQQQQQQAAGGASPASPADEAIRLRKEAADARGEAEVLHQELKQLRVKLSAKGMVELEAPPQVAPPAGAEPPMMADSRPLSSTQRSVSAQSLSESSVGSSGSVGVWI